MDSRHTASPVYTTLLGTSRLQWFVVMPSWHVKVAATVITLAAALSAAQRHFGCDTLLASPLRKGLSVDMHGNAFSFPSSRRAGHKRRLTAITFVLLLAGTATAALATPSDPGMSRARLRQINGDILQARRQLSSTQRQQSAARQAVRDAESALANTHAQLDDLVQQQREVNQRLAALDHRAQSLNKARERQQQALAEQLAALYRLGHEPQLKLLLEQHDPTRLERYQHYFNALDRARQERLAALQRLDSEVAANRQDEEQQRRRLSALIEAQKDREHTLTQQHQTRQQALEALGHSFQNDQARLQSLTQEREQAEAVIEQIERAVAAERARIAAEQRAAADRHRQPPPGATTVPGTAPGEPPSGCLTSEELNAEASDSDSSAAAPSPTPATARFDASWSGRWPINGRVIASYRQGEGVDKNGILIAAPAGTPIHAMAAGQVVFADWLNGFGYLVIVDHGRAMTVYAHNQRNTVTTGDRIRKGTIIGTVGDTGGRDSPALHFEVRRQGHPVDPDSWSG